MPIFQIQRFEELLQRGRDRLVARAPDLTDIQDGSNISQVVGAPARIVEMFFFELARLLELSSLQRARGADLDAKAAEYLPVGLARGGSTRAVGTLLWTRETPTASAIAIPAGTIVTQSAAKVTYVTTAPGEIPAGGTASVRTDGPGGNIPARAQAPGREGNAPIGTPVRQLSTIAGVNQVVISLGFTGGTDRESDDAFRNRIIQRTRALPRCVPEALETRALEAQIAGNQVILAKYIRQPWEVAQGTIYIDDGSGSIESFMSTAADEDFVTSATGGESRFNFANRPLRGTEWVVTRTPNAAPDEVLTADVDYKIVPSQGLLVLSPTVFPGGLTSGDRLRVAPYSYYTGLIAEAQRLIDGDPSDPGNFPSYAGGGVVIKVQAPTVRWQVVSCTITVIDGYDRSALVLAVKAAISQYINTLNVGEDVILNTIRQRAMSVPGMYDILFDTPVTSAPVGDTEIARINSANLEVN